MRVLIQWAQSTPGGWIEREISRVQDWRALPDKGQPASPGQPVDAQPGWINAMNVQGVVFTGYDRYTVLGTPGGGLQVIAWQDSDDFAPGERWASVWTFLAPAPDPRIGGRINTRQTRTVYAEPGAGLPLGMNPQPWGEFSPPPQNNQRFGKWLPDELFLDHMRALPLRGWREWVE